MKPFGPQAQKWLKVCHIAFAGTWLASAITIALVSSLLSSDDGMQMLGIHRTAKFVDDFILIPAANGTWVTGLLFSLKTRWGWFKHRWIPVKWAIAISGIVVGTFVLGPNLNALPAMVRELGATAFAHPKYLSSRNVILYLGSFQVATLLLACSLPVLKPWGAHNRNARSASVQPRHSEPEVTA